MKLKVYGGGGSINRKDCRLIVMAASQKEAVSLLNACKIVGYFSLNYFRNYWCETGNEQELAIATEKGVWCCREQCSKNRRYIKLDPQRLYKNL